MHNGLNEEDYKNANLKVLSDIEEYNTDDLLEEYDSEDESRANDENDLQKRLSMGGLLCKNTK